MVSKLTVALALIGLAALVQLSSAKPARSHGLPDVKEYMSNVFDKKDFFPAGQTYNADEKEKEIIEDQKRVDGWIYGSQTWAGPTPDDDLEELKQYFKDFEAAFSAALEGKLCGGKGCDRNQNVEALHNAYRQAQKATESAAEKLQNSTVHVQEALKMIDDYVKKQLA